MKSWIQRHWLFVAMVAAPTVAAVLYYGLEDVRWGERRLQHSADARQCPRCTADLVYEGCFYAHLGHYFCPKCDWRRPKPQVSARLIEMDGMRGSSIELDTPSGAQRLTMPLPGIYNVYNAVAALTWADDLEVAEESLDRALAEAERRGRLMAVATASFRRATRF